MSDEIVDGNLSVEAVNEVRIGSEQIAATMEELASGAETQAILQIRRIYSL